jgi:tetratricopeptide (TPR) repeat protein
MSGVGKSELALQYSWREWENKTYLGGIAWLNVAESDPGLSILTFVQLHLRLILPTEGELVERIRFCWHNWFKNEQDQALIIFDDVRRYEQIKDYLPPQGEKRFKVIITTRNEQIARNFNPIDLEVLSPDAAVELLAFFLPNAVVNNQEKARELVKWLGYLPLGIELVGRYGQYMSCELTELLAQLQAQKLKDESLQFPQNAFMTAQRGVAAAFELSWGELSESSRLAGEWLSLFAESRINEKLILSLFEVAKTKPLSAKPTDGISAKIEKLFPTFSRWFGLSKSVSASINPPDLPIPTRTDLRHLVNLNLLTDVDNQNYDLHTLIRMYLRDKLEASAFKEQAKRAYCQVMARIAKDIKYTLTLEDVANLEPDIEHIKVVAEELNQWLDNEDLIYPFVGLVSFYRAQGLYYLAVPYGEQCLTLSKQRLGKNHRDFAYSLNALASLYHAQGKYAKAETLYRRSLAILERQLGKEHSDVAQSLNNLAVLYRTQGKYAEAEPLLLRALAITEKQLGEEHPHVASSVNNLAAFYHDQGKYAEAETLYQRSLAILEKQLGKEHPDVATSLNNLASLYKSQAKYAEAEPLLLQALAILEKQLGEEHPLVATSLNNLATCYHDQKKYAEAETLYQRSLAIWEKQLGKDHPDVAQSLNNLAGLYNSQGKYAEAEPLFLHSLGITEKQLGKKHPSVATSLNNLANLYRAQGKYAEAEPLYLQALAILEKQLGAEHLDVAQSLNNLAGLYNSQGKYAEAETLYTNLANIYRAQGKYAKAVPLYLRALAITEKQLGKEHLDVGQSLNNLAKLYYAQGKYTKAEPLYLRALAIIEKQLGAEHPDIATSLNNLAKLYGTQGKYAEAEPLYQKAIAILIATLGENHPNTQTVKSNYNQ